MRQSAGKLYKLDTTEVDHFELLDDNRKLISSGSPSQGQIFTAVSFSGIGMYPEHAQLAGSGSSAVLRENRPDPQLPTNTISISRPQASFALSRRSTGAEPVVSNWGIRWLAPDGSHGRLPVRCQFLPLHRDHGVRLRPLPPSACRHPTIRAIVTSSGGPHPRVLNERRSCVESHDMAYAMFQDIPYSSRLGRGIQRHFGAMGGERNRQILRSISAKPAPTYFFGRDSGGTIPATR